MNKKLSKFSRHLIDRISRYPVGGFIFIIAKSMYLLFTSKEYRNLLRYKTLYGFKPRFKDTKVACCYRQLCVPDIASFLSMYEEIFLNKIYEIPKKPSKVLDLGANIGLSILWLKDNFPEACIVGYEADEKIFGCLQRNVKNLENVRIYNKAVWHEDTELSFVSEGADGGRVDKDGGSKEGLVTAIDIRRVLNEEGPFSFIKMDIEGAEASVIPACRGLLSKTDFIFCEYHSIEGERQNLDEILHVLREEGFRIHIQPVSISKQPFIRRNNQAGFDMQLNVFGWRS